MNVANYSLKTKEIQKREIILIRKLLIKIQPFSSF